MTTLRIDFVSDVVCPWCAIGLASLEHALLRLDGVVQAELHFQPFELDPNMPAGGMEVADNLKRKYGMGDEQLAENQASERGEVVDLFVQSIDDDDAHVFAVVQVRAVNRILQTPRSDTVRVDMSMTRVDGEWRVYDFLTLDGLSVGLPVEPSATDATTPTTVPSGG